jgi:hypothetical protein
MDTNLEIIELEYAALKPFSFQGVQSTQPCETALQYRQRRLKELNVLYSLSQELGLSEPLDSLLHRVAQDVVRITQANFCRLLTLENDGAFLLRASVNHHGEKTGSLKNQRYSLPGLVQYLWLMRSGSPIILSKDDPDLSSQEASILGLDQVSKVWLAPLRMGNEPFGLLALDEDQDALRKQVSTSWMDLVEAISELTGNIVHRARFHERIEERYIKTIWSLARAIDNNDPFAGSHGQRTADLVEGIALCMGLPQQDVETFHLAGTLHDIGKVGIPENILQKPGKLTAEEWEVMKKHPQLGVDILSPVAEFAPIIPIVRAHHEKFDGSGYPLGLKGEEIPLGARILSVADAFSTMTTGRIYRLAISTEDAISELRRCRGSHFDPFIVDASVDYLNSK